MAHNDIFVQVNMHFLGLNERSSTQDVSKWLVNVLSLSSIFWQGIVNGYSIWMLCVYLLVCWQI